MKILLKIIFIIFLLLGSFSINSYTGFAADENLKTGSETHKGEQKNDYLEGLKNDETDFSTEIGGRKGILNATIRIARDIKNLFLIIASVYFLILVLRLILSDKADEEITNFKKGIIRISLGIMTTQIAFYFVQVLFDQSIDYVLAKNFVEVIIQPLINLLKTGASFFFIAIMIYSFYRIITAGGDDEKAKSGKMSVLYAGLGFIVINISTALIDAIYGTIDSFGYIGVNSTTNTNIGGFSEIVVKIINWLNGFIGIIVVIMVIYAGFLSLTSFGDEEKLKKAKNIITYIAVGLFILVANYLILTFFVNKGINLL